MSVATCDLPFGLDLSRCTITADELLRVTEALGKDAAMKLLDQASVLAGLTARLTPLMYGAARTNSSGSAKSASSQGLAGLTGTRLASAQSVALWREKCEASPPRIVPNGMCYTKLLTRNSAESLAMKLGTYPNFSALVRTRSTAFHDLDQLRRFRLVPRGEGVYHVAAGGTEGAPFLPCVARYAAGVKVPDGTLAGLVKSKGETTEQGIWIGGRAAIGGSSGSKSVSDVVFETDVSDSVTSSQGQFVVGFYDYPGPRARYVIVDSRQGKPRTTNGRLTHDSRFVYSRGLGPAVVGRFKYDKLSKRWVLDTHDQAPA